MVLRTEIHNVHSVHDHDSARDSRHALSQATAASHLPQAQETGRWKKQCDSLRTVLRQKENELGQEKQTTSQLKTAIKVAHNEYVKTLAKCRQEVSDLQKDRCKHEERARVLQQHLEDALKRTDADSKSVTSLRCLNKTLNDELHRHRQMETRGICEPRCLLGEPAHTCAPRSGSPLGSCASANLMSPRGSGADTNDKGPSSPHGPEGCTDRDNAATHAARLLLRDGEAEQRSDVVAASHFAEASDACVPAAAILHPQDSARDAVYAGSNGNDAGAAAILAAQVQRLEKQLEHESAARRRDQLAVMEHISCAERDKHRMTLELAARSKMCSQLETRLAETRLLVSRTTTAHFHSAKGKELTAHGGDAWQEQMQEENTGQDLLSSLLGVFTFQVACLTTGGWLHMTRIVDNVCRSCLFPRD